MRRKAHVFALGLLDNLDVGCVALGGIPNLLLLPYVISVGGSGCLTLELEDGDAFICRRVEGGTISRIELGHNPFIETLFVKIYPFSIHHCCF